MSGHREGLNAQQRHLDGDIAESCSLSTMFFTLTYRHAADEQLPQAASSLRRHTPDTGDAAYSVRPEGTRPVAGGALTQQHCVLGWPFHSEVHFYPGACVQPACSPGALSRYPPPVFPGTSNEDPQLGKCKINFSFTFYFFSLLFFFLQEIRNIKREAVVKRKKLTPK